MRTFVITTPGLSIGRPGRHMTAAEMRMDDDKLDAFVQAGHAIEVFDDGDRPRADTAPDDTPLDTLAPDKPTPKPRSKPRSPRKPQARGGS